MSSDLTFRTEPPADSQDITFTMQADSRGIGTVCTAVFEAMKPHTENGFCISLGDIVGRGEDDGATDWWQIQFFNRAKEYINRYCLYPSIGNHEVYRYNASDIVYPAVYEQIWTLPTANSGTEIYYSFDKGNVHFACIDTWWSEYGVGSDQYNWLKNDLETSTKKWKIIMAHNGPYVSRGGLLQGDSKIRSDLVPLFETYGVDFYTHGHYHIYQQNVVNGITYLVQGISGDTLGAADDSQPFVQFYATDRYGFTRMDTSPDKLTVTAYGGIANGTSLGGPIEVFHTFDIYDNPVKPTPTPTPYVEEIIVDDGETGHSLDNVSAWTYANSPTYNDEPYNNDYYWTYESETETRWSRWVPNLPEDDNYHVFVRFRDGTNRVLGAPYTVFYDGGSETKMIDQSINGGLWMLMGNYPFKAGTSGYVRLSNGGAIHDDTHRVIIADAVRFTHIVEPTATPTQTNTPIPSAMWQVK